MQTRKFNSTRLVGIFVTFFALAGLVPGIQAANSQFAYTNTGNFSQSDQSPFQNRYSPYSVEENRVTVTIPMNGKYFSHRKTLKLKSLITDYSNFRPRDYTLDRVTLAAAYRSATQHNYDRESYAYLKTKKQVSERKQIPYARNDHSYQQIDLNAHQSVTANDWKLYIGPNVEINSITLFLIGKSRGHSRYTNYQETPVYNNRDKQHWSEFANIRTKKENRGDEQLRIPLGARQIKLVGERRDTDILYAWVSYSDGRIQRMYGLQGTLQYGQSVKASIRRGQHQTAQATLHLVFKPHTRGHRSNLSVQSA